jgi:hypothetical protein
LTLHSHRQTRVIVLALAFVFSVRTASAADMVDLGRRYPATLDYSPTPKGYDWTCDERDVWRLTNFAFSLSDRFRVEVKSAQVVMGHHGSNVLWAAVFPDQTGEIVKADAGQGEHITSIWLRFHPARLAEIFPPATVTELGRKELVGDAKRLAAHKMKSCWQSNGQPMVPEKAIVTLDLETREGHRRFFSINTAESICKYFDVFNLHTVPVATNLDRETALQVFDTVWSAFDREYAMFVLKPKVDWPKLRGELTRYPSWAIGRVADELISPSEAIEFDEPGWSVAAVQARFRSAVEAFGPENVVITDGWNMKPFLAEAVRGCPYFLLHPLQRGHDPCPRLGVRSGGRLSSPRRCAIRPRGVVSA